MIQTNLDNQGITTTSFHERALQGLSEGETLVLDQLDRRIPSLNRFCRTLEPDLNYRLHTNVYVMAPGGRGDDEALALHELLPPGFLDLDQAQLAGCLLEWLPSLPSLESALQAVERFTTGWVRRHRPDLTGRLVDLLCGDEIDDERKFGPRPGLIYRIQGAGPDLELLCGRVVMRFDQRIRAAMLYCLETGRYRPRDLPAPLTQAEKLELVSSLTRAGLVTRGRGD